MPSYTNYYYRHWCPKCNDWTIFEEKGKFGEDKKLLCNECETEHQKTLLSDIPKDKLLEQRERYKAQKSQDCRDIYTKFLTGGFNRNPLMDMLMETPTTFDERIVESDAGQRAIDEAKKQKERQESYEREMKRQEKLKWKAQYKGLGRNDKCVCGSGKKYKKCCLSEVEKIR